MESTITHLTTTSAAALSEEKAAKVMYWISESEDSSKTDFAVARVFETGVLQDNTKAFLHLLLEEKHPDERLTLELPPQEFHALLRDAFTDTYRYLLTPQLFIAEFLSFGSDTLYISESMLARLSYFVNYSFFAEMLDEWFAIELQSSKADLDKSILTKFLSDVDRSIMKYSSLEEIAKYLEPIFEYHESKIIARNSVELLFSDKGLTIPADNAQQEFSSEDIAFAIKEAYLASEVIGPVEELAPIRKYDEFLKELREIGVVLPPPSLAHTIAEEEKNLLPPIQMFISSKLRKKCLEKIFRENKYEYDRAITLLNTIEDYSQAELNLRSLLDMHKIRADSKTSIRLNQALRLRFNITSPIHSF